jgi:hypothetical protein
MAILYLSLIFPAALLSPIAIFLLNVLMSDPTM